MTHKGIASVLIMGIALLLVMVLAAFAFIKSTGFASVFAGTDAPDAVLQTVFDYQTDFSALLGEADQLLYVNNFSAYGKNIEHRIFAADTRLIDDRLYGWASLYAHANNTSSNAYRFVNTRTDVTSRQRLERLLTKRLKATADTLYKDDMYYRVHFVNVSVVNDVQRNVNALGKIALPVIAPGNVIEPFVIEREETLYSLIMEE